MARSVTRSYQGQNVAGQLLEYDTISEPWSEYRCEDGTTLKLRVIASEIVRLDQYSQGDPVYMVKMSPVVAPDVPDELKESS